MLMVGFETLPRRMTGLPATGGASGFVMSRPGGRLPCSPGSPPGQRLMTSGDLAARAFPTDNETKQTETSRTTRLAFMRAVKRRQGGESKKFFFARSCAIELRHDLTNGARVFGRAAAARTDDVGAGFERGGNSECHVSGKLFVNCLQVFQNGQTSIGLNHHGQ